MNRHYTRNRSAAAVLAALALAGCTAKEPTSADGPREPITVEASDTACALSVTEAATGPTTFLVTNNGTKATEFYVYGTGDRVLGEVENVSPGLQRKLIVNITEPGTYRTACKPGMIGDGIRGDFVVTGAAVNVDADGKFAQAAADYKRYVTRSTAYCIR